MATKRMFSKSITNSSSFLMMPQSSQNLYFHLGMNADDDGFCEHFTIMRMTESKPDDLKVLQAKKFIYIFDDKVLVIKDWKENNYIRSDRYTPSKYLKIYKEEIKRLCFGIPDDIPKVDADKIRLGKVRLGKNKSNAKTSFASSIFSAYKKKINQNAHLTESAKEIIKTALKSFSETQLLEVITNKADDDFYKQNNARRGIGWLFENKKRLNNYLGEEKVGSEEEVWHAAKK